MKLPIRREPLGPMAVPSVEYDAFDGWGGAIRLGKIFVKECSMGEVVPKETAIPYRRGIVNKKVVFYYLKKGEIPPSDDLLIPSVWEVD